MAVQYPEYFIEPMRAELSSRGVIETRTPEQVDALLAPGSGTVLMVVNSVCGCAAGSARPGVLKSLEGDVRPDKVATVFAGGDIEAVAHVRQILAPLPPSSPSAALFRDRPRRLPPHSFGTASPSICSTGTKSKAMTRRRSPKPSRRPTKNTASPNRNSDPS